MSAVHSDLVCRNLYMDTDSPCSMKSPVRCVYEDLFIWNADVVIRLNRVHLHLETSLRTSKKAIVHGTPTADIWLFFIALSGFNDLGRSVTPTFLFRNRFHLQLSPHCPKMNKKINVGSLKNFKISVYGR